MSDCGPPSLLGGMGPESGANLYYLPEGRTPVTGSDACISTTCKHHCSSESDRYSLESVWTLGHHRDSVLVAVYTEGDQV